MIRLFHIKQCLFLLVFVQSSLASVLRVPNEYLTIQSALDATADGDTVLAAAGLYVESLIAPQHSFSLTGETIPDSSTIDLTVLDATSLPGSYALTTITTSLGTTVHLRNLVIRNGPEMRNREGGSGGVRNYAALLTVTNCRFDSVASPVYGGSDIHVNNCMIIGAVLFGVASSIGGRVLATNSVIDGSGYYLVFGDNGTTVENCEIRGGHVERFIIGTGTIRVQNSHFGPTGGSAIGPLHFNNPVNSIVENCLFHGITDAGEIIEVSRDCGPADYTPITISNNLFMDYGPQDIPHGVTGILLTCQEYEQGDFGIIENNVFLNGSQSQAQAPTGAFVQGTARFQNNRFINLLSHSNPVISTWRNASFGDSVILRDNLFEPEGLGVLEQNVDVDARWNWWGHESGPFHAVENPDGQGAEVGNGIEFIPWWTDTNFTESIDARIELPREFSLEVYPNPFNASTRIAFTTTKPGIYGLDVVNLLGQKVKEIWSGPVAYERSWRIDLADLSSGVYFARVRDTIHNRPVALTKLVLLK